MRYIDSFEIFESKYQTYDDYAKTSMKWGSSDDLKEDAKLIVKRIVPTDWDQAEDQIESIEDQSSDKGIKISVTLKSGDVIHLYKIGPMRGSWEIYLNRKKQRDANAARTELMKSMKPLHQYLFALDRYDHTWHFADDGRAYRAGQSQAKELETLYKALSSSDRQIAYEKYLSKFGTTNTFKEFTGAY